MIRTDKKIAAAFANAAYGGAAPALDTVTVSDSEHVSALVCDLRCEIEAVRTTQMFVFQPIGQAWAAAGSGGATAASGDGLTGSGYSSTDPSVWPVAEVTCQTLMTALWREITTKLCVRLSSASNYDPVHTLKMYPRLKAFRNYALGRTGSGSGADTEMAELTRAFNPIVQNVLNSKL